MAQCRETLCVCVCRMCGVPMSHPTHFWARPHSGVGVRKAGEVQMHTVLRMQCSLPSPCVSPSVPTLLPPPSLFSSPCKAPEHTDHGGGCVERQNGSPLFKSFLFPRSTLPATHRERFRGSWATGQACLWGAQGGLLPATAAVACVGKRGHATLHLI